MCDWNCSRLLTVQYNESCAPNSPTRSGTRSASGRHLPPAGRFAFQGHSDLRFRERFCHRRHFHHVLEDRRNHSSLLCNGDRSCRLCARNSNARVFPRPFDGYQHGNRQAMGASLRRGSDRVHRIAWILVLRRLRLDPRSLCPSRQFLHDDRICDGHLRAEFRKHTLRDRANLMRGRR